MSIRRIVLLIVGLLGASTSHAQVTAHGDEFQAVKRAFQSVRATAPDLPLILVKGDDTTLTGQIAASLGALHYDRRDIFVCHEKRCRLKTPGLTMSLDKTSIQGDSAVVWISTWVPSGLERMPVRSDGLRVYLTRDHSGWRVTKTTTFSVS